jgi:hypothetical protein
MRSRPGRSLVLLIGAEMAEDEFWDAGACRPTLPWLALLATSQGMRSPGWKSMTWSLASRWGSACGLNISVESTREV